MGACGVTVGRVAEHLLLNANRYVNETSGLLDVRITGLDPGPDRKDRMC